MIERGIGKPKIRTILERGQKSQSKDLQLAFFDYQYIEHTQK